MIGQRTLAVERTATPRVRSTTRGITRQQTLLLRPALAAQEQVQRAIETSVLGRLVAAMTLFAIAGLLYLAQASQVSVHEFNIADLQQQQGLLAMQNASLRAQSTSLQSPDRIAQVAGTQLHMAPPDLSRGIWITPVLPTVAPVAGSDADTQAAVQGSQPAAWMHRLVTLIQSSL